MKTAIAALAPIALLAACSPYGGVHDLPGLSGHGGAYEVAPAYAYGSCAGGACAPGQGYSVAPAPAPAPYGTAAVQQVPHASPYGGAPHALPVAGLRGRHDGKRGYLYGDLGGVAFDTDDTTFGAFARLGYQTSSFLGAEVEGVLGLTDLDASGVDPALGAFTGEAGIDSQLAGFAVARVPLSPRFNILGRGGYHTTQATAEVTLAGVTVEESMDIDGFAYGAGLEYSVGARSALRLDATRYDGGNDGELDTVSLAYQHRF